MGQLEGIEECKAIHAGADEIGNDNIHFAPIRHPQRQFTRSDTDCPAVRKLLQNRFQGFTQRRIVIDNQNDWPSPLGAA